MIKTEDILPWYAERLPTVEINNTFYRMPKASVLEGWAAATPATFRFSIKASRRITHDTRLKADSAAEPLAYLYKNLGALGDKRGPVMVQLPPNLKTTRTRPGSPPPPGAICACDSNTTATQTSTTGPTA